MRIIAGKYKGRKLESPKGDLIRPTSDKVKEAVFGSLQFDIPGAVVLDAFAGSGALGIEALSRGAAHVDFVEKNGSCIATLYNNLKLIETNNYNVIRGDVIRSADRLSKYDIIFLDPPYDEGLYIPFLEMAAEHKLIKKGGRIVLECRRKFDFALPKEYNFSKKKDYGDISLWFLYYEEV